jgi:uncharacterized membrane protein YvbJ
MYPDRKCSKCGRIIPLESKICPYCGIKFSDDAIAQEKKEVEEYFKNIEKTHKIKVIIGLTLFITILIIISYLYVIYAPRWAPPPCKYPIFIKDSNNKSIVVNHLNYDDHNQIVWENVKVVNGNLDLPYGEIITGQRIDNCSGRITLEWIPCNELIFDEEFE